MKISTKKIEILLAENALTKSELARQCGMARQNISLILQRGSCEPITAGRLAKTLGVSVTDIVEEDG